MFVRYALLTAYRQLVRRIAGTPQDAFGASSASFRQTSTAVSAASSVRRATKPSRTESSFPPTEPRAASSGVAGIAEVTDNDSWMDDSVDELQAICDSIPPAHDLASDYEDEDDGALGGIPDVEFDDLEVVESDAESDDVADGTVGPDGTATTTTSPSPEGHCVVS